MRGNNFICFTVSSKESFHHDEDGGGREDAEPVEAPEADPQEVSDQQRYDEIVDAVTSRVLNSKCFLL